MGQKVELPIMCSPAAMAKLVHPDGEKAIARGCQCKGIIQCVSLPAFDERSPRAHHQYHLHPQIDKREA